MSNTQDFDIYEYINKNETAKELFYSCYTMEDKRYYYSRREKVFERIRNDKVIFDLIKYDYPELIKIELVGKKEKEVLDLPSTFLSTTFFLNTIDMVIDKIDLFQLEPLKLEKTDRILSITRNTYFLREPKYIPHITDEIKATILNDYKVHFPELDNILKWIVACRFTKDRRSSFLHLHLSAGFGKDFFQSIFKDLGLLVECRTDDFKSPSPLRAGEFRNSFVMLINEFTIFKKDYKNLIYNMILDSKNQLRTEVELFAKIFLSAEESNSFVDGVDKQITDRVNQIKKEKIIPELKDRQVFKEYDSSIYYNVVYHYIYHFFKSTIQQYIDLGEINASKRASNVLRKFHSVYKLDVELLDDKVKTVFWDTVFNIINYKNDESHFNKIERDISNNIVVITIDNVETYYITKFKKTFELIMQNEDEEFYKKARYKTSQMHTILGLNKKDIDKTHRIDGKPTKSFKFIKRDIIEFQDKEGTTTDFIHNPVIANNIVADTNNSLFDEDNEIIPF